MEGKIKHLEMIQNVISRMANNSFLLKGWTVTIVSAILVFDIQDTDRFLLLVSSIPIFAFWMLDGYFLRQERLYRKLYSRVVDTDESDINFSMNTTNFQSAVPNWLSTIFSKTLLIFYGCVLISALAVWFSKG